MQGEQALVALIRACLQVIQFGVDLGQLLVQPSIRTLVGLPEEAVVDLGDRLDQPFTFANEIERCFGTEDFVDASQRTSGFFILLQLGPVGLEVPLSRT